MLSQRRSAHFLVDHPSIPLRTLLSLGLFATMSVPPSSTPTLSADDNWQDFTSSLLTSLPTLQASSGSSVSSPPSQPSSAGSSGKFHSFTFVGAAVSGGGSRRALLITQPRSGFERLCLGLVGSNKFCTKERLSGSGSCGFSKHETSKFDALPNTCYVKFNEIQAHCTPTLAIETLSEIQVRALSERVFTVSEWGTLFHEIATGSLPDWVPQDQLAVQTQDGGLTVQPFGILSPTAGPGTLFDFQPTLSFDSSDSSIIDKNTTDLQLWKAKVVPPELIDHVD